MLRKFTVFVFTLLITAQAVAVSPYRGQENVTTSDFLRQPYQASSYSGLLDPSRLSMQHQMGMGYMSAGGRGYTQAYYLNTLTYRFNAPVLMRLHLGVANNPFASYSSTGPGESAMTNMFNNAEFFGGADIEWQPRDNVHLRFSVHKMPAGMYNPYGYASPYSRYGSRYYNPAYSGSEHPFMDW